MKKYLLSALAIFFLATVSSFSQILKPVKWQFYTEKISDSEVNLVFKATIDDGWHIYGMDIPEGGPISTSFNFDTTETYPFMGKVTSDMKPVTEYDKAFAMNIEIYTKQVIFRQKIRKAADKDITVKGYVEFMSCNNQRCLAPTDEDFEFNVPAVKKGVAAAEKKPETPAVAAVTTSGEEDHAKTAEIAEPAVRTVERSNEIQQAEATDIATGEGKKSTLWGIFIISLLAGFSGLLTPCVYPMIPLTVSYFMRGEKSRARAITDALVFGLSIVAIYTSIGVIVSLFKADASSVNAISTNWILNSIFFLVFVVFAASFFGMFELVLPSGFTNKIDSKADKGGMLGAFFMALAMTVISFSCTGPIVGALLIEASQGHFWRPIVGMFGFAIIFALPFTLFAIFPSWLKGLPKSGGWLNSVKIVLGFIVLAFGFKYLSTIDQSYHLGLLSRSTFLAIWIVLFTLLGFYLLGKLKFAHDSEVKHIGFPRLLLAVVTFVFVIYLVRGLFGAPLTAVSALIPPPDNSTTLFMQGNNNVISAAANAADSSAELCGQPKYADFLHLPYGLKGYFDYDQAIACAAEKNKPLLIDFNGHGCANCKDMEARVWPDPQVMERLRNDFIIVSLYVDDKTKLPESEWVVSSYDGRTKKTIGKINADFQISRFNANTQPLYVIVGKDGKELTKENYGHDTDVNDFIRFLDEGINNYKKKYD